MRYGKKDGKRYPVRAITRLVGEEIKKLRAREFTIEALVARLPFYRRHVKDIIVGKTKRGQLVRVRSGVYKRPRRPYVFTKCLAMGEAADATWAALMADSENFRAFSEILADAESRINRPGRDCRSAIEGAVYKWVKADYVERIGVPGSYTYRPKPGIIERPPLSKTRKRVSQ